LSNLYRIAESKNKVSQHVILIHGLGGDHKKTWQNKNAYWPEWLAEDIDELAVWAIDYDASVSRWNGSAMHLVDRGSNILARILGEQGLETGEITLIGHSLGGLVIKELLRTADSDASLSEPTSRFLSRVHRIGFLATPHRGASKATLGDRLRILIRPTEAMSSLVRNDPNLKGLNRWYQNWSKDQEIEHLILVETQPMSIIGMIVEPDSSDPGLTSAPIPVDSNHTNICKPINRNSEVYIHISNFVKKATSSNLKQGREELVDLLKKTIGRTNLRSQNFSKDLVDAEIQEQVKIIKQSRFFWGEATAEYAEKLGDKILNAEYSNGSDQVRSQALAWCARFLSSGGHVDKYDDFLNEAKRLGDCHEITIAEAFRISTESDLTDALQHISSINSPESRSAGVFIVKNCKGARAAIDWLNSAGIEFLDLDGDGKFIVVSLLLELGELDTALEHVKKLRESDFNETPSLIHISAFLHLMQAVPEDLRTHVQQHLPFHSRTFPLASTTQALQSRKQSRDYFHQFAGSARQLNLEHFANISDDYALWLELRDPGSLNTGIEKLEASMRDSTQSLRRIPLALQFGVALDLEAVEDMIDQQSALSGGTSPETALARFALAFQQDSPKSIVAYINKHRAQLLAHIAKRTISILEIEMLVRAGSIQQAESHLARAVEEGLSEAEVSDLRSIIDEYTGGDPRANRIAQYEESGRLDDLVNLVTLLQERNDWDDLCHYGRILFNQTKQLADIERLARTYYETKRFTDLVELLNEHPEFLEQSERVRMLYCWSLYFSGFIIEARSELAKYKGDTQDPNYQGLKINIVISVGDWSSLQKIIAEVYANKDKNDAQQLLKAAQLGLHADVPYAKELLFEATKKGSNDPNILTAAYFTASTAGWEDDTEVRTWLSKAAQLSDNDGPVQMKTPKDLVEMLPDWNQHETEIWKQLSTGSIPVFMAGIALNKSLVDLVTFPAYGNMVENDTRRRTSIPAYSGIHNRIIPDLEAVIGIGPIALLTLSMLDLIDQVIDVANKIVIPHATLTWLFEEKQKATFHQPSRIRDAHEISGFLNTGVLRKLVPTTIPDDDLSEQVGVELALMITEAEKSIDQAETQKIVVRPSPVHRIQSLLQEEADLTPHSRVLSSCLALVEKLRQMGHLTASEESKAKVYLHVVNEKPWTNQPDILDGAVLYLDDLAVIYFLHLGMLNKLHQAGFQLMISAGKVEETNQLIFYETISGHVHDTLEIARKALHRGIESGKVRIGEAVHDDRAQEDIMARHPTMGLFALAAKCDLILSDDRNLNQHINMSDKVNQAPVFTSLDIINYFKSSESISIEKWFELRTKLRNAGYIFIPTISEEIQHHLDTSTIAGGKLLETAELKAIRESILQVKMRDWLQLPKEINWLNAVVSSMLIVLKELWVEESDIERQIACSNWIVGQIDARGWEHNIENLADEEFIMNMRKGQLLFLLSPPAEAQFEQREEYWSWLEDRILVPIKELEPELYSWLIKWIRGGVADMAEIDLSENNENEE